MTVSSKMYVNILGLVILLAGLCTCRSKPALPSIRNAGEQSVTVQTVEPSSNPVDLGVLRKCEQPKLSNIDMGVCSEHVSYSVPSTLLKPLSLSNTLLYISTTYFNTYDNKQYDGYDSTECAAVVLKYMCSLYFPKCEASTDKLKAEFSLDNCSQEIESKCSPTIRGHLVTYSGICYINSSRTVLAAKCKPSSAYTFRKGEGFCASEVAGWSDVFLTELMHVQLQHVEKLIEGNWHLFNQTLTNSARAKECTQAYARLACQSVGKCWDQGNRAEMTATREDCEYLVGCNEYVEGFNCSNFPSESIIPSTPATPATDLSATMPFNTGMPVAEFPLSINSSSSLHSISFIRLLFLSVLMALALNSSSSLHSISFIGLLLLPVLMEVGFS